MSVMLHESTLYIDSCNTGAFRDVCLPAGIATAVIRLGLSDAEIASRRIDLALRAALTHESYLYEHQEEAPHLSPSVLKALETLGSSWVTRELAVWCYQRERHAGPGRLSDAVALGRTLLGPWSSTAIEWLPQSALFGRSLNSASLPERVTTRIMFQLLGLLCLLGHDPLARQLAASFIEYFGKQSTTAVLDPITRLVNELKRAGLSPEWTFQTTGPDHEQVFKARVTDTKGRVATGIGRSKKAARASASEAFLRQHLSHSLGGEASEPPPLPTAIPRTATTRHREVIFELADRFQLSRTNLPLLSQAFLHSSWAYENATEVRYSGQQDNQVLGLVGSHVLTYEHALVAAREAVVSGHKSFTFQSSLNDTFAAALVEAGLRPGLLLSNGQPQSAEIDLAANAFQAAMAAVFLGRGRPRSLLEQWPDGWETVADIIAPSETRAKDPTTQLQELSVVAELSCNYGFSSQGPDHDRRYSAALTLGSSHINRQLTVKGAHVRGKTRAKHDASQRVLACAEQLADAASIAALNSAQGQRRGNLAMSIFLLGHLAAAASASPRRAPSWRSQKLFGAHLTSQLRHLSAWARAVDQLLAKQAMVSPDPERLEQFYRAALAGDETVQRSLRAELTNALDSVSRLEDPARIEDFEADRLADLASAYRAAGLDQPGGLLEELLDDLVILHRGNFQIVGRVNPLDVTAIEQSVIEALVKCLTAGGGRVQAHFSDDAGRVVFSPVSVPEDRVSLLIRVWGQLSPRFFLQIIPEGIALTLPVPVDSGLGPVQDAVERALQPLADPLSTAIANLLHDLKNQVVAARQAARTTGGGRTSDLEHRVAASRHLDQASAIAHRIGAATSLLGPSGNSATELSDFLRRYAASRLLTLPANISLVPARSAGAVDVGLDESSLLAILDNLVKNAVQAMPDGGTIRLDCIHDDHMALLEVADDGPGLPDHVERALASRQRIASAKPGGNGLGLRGVQTLLRRIGGSLELIPGDTGTRWHLTIPIAQDWLTASVGTTWPPIPSR